MKRQPPWLISMMAAAVLFAGCVSSGTVQVDGRVIDGSSQTLHNIRVNGIRPIQVTQSKADTGLIRAQVELQNTSYGRRTILYQFIWFDDAGMILPSTTKGWKQVILESKESRIINDVSPSALSKRFTIKFRKQR